MEETFSANRWRNNDLDTDYLLMATPIKFLTRFAGNRNRFIGISAYSDGFFAIVFCLKPNNAKLPLKSTAISSKSFVNV